MKIEEIRKLIIEELRVELDTVSFYYGICLNLVKSAINKMSYEELVIFIKEELEPCRNQNTVSAIYVGDKNEQRTDT